MAILKYLGWGLLSGLIGAIAGAAVLWGAWLLPALGLLLTNVGLFYGLISMFILGALGGCIYALLFRTKRLSLFGSILTGIVFGLFMWVGGILIAVPLLIGFPIQFSNFREHLVSLAAFILYGLVVSLVYSRWTVKKSSRLLYAAGIILVSVIAAPLMLRMAVSTNPKDLSLPQGYRAEVVAKGLTYPTSICIDEKDNIYIGESGYSYGPKTTIARVLRIDKGGNIKEFARDFEAPLNGLAVKGEHLYVSHKGKITEINLKNKLRRDIVTNLPSLGDHQNNDLLFGEDGALYFGQGTATNAGVVGHDNFVYAWADNHPSFHDVPSRDFVMTGENYLPLDLGSVNPVDKEPTGAFSPFGKTQAKGKVVKAQVPANGAIHRIDLTTGKISIYADGLRNPFGLALSPEGKIYATNLGYDDRGVRAVKSSPDWVVEVKEGAWYGWPDYAGTIPLSSEEFTSERGINRKPLISNPPAVTPPLASLPSHYSPMKLAYAPDGFKNKDLFVAIYGDGQPLTQDLKSQVPTGVLQIDPENGKTKWFVTNKNKPRAGRMGDGLKRAIDVKFCRDGKSMYILDFGILEFTDLAPNPIPNSGVLWKFSRQD